MLAHTTTYSDVHLPRRQRDEIKRCLRDENGVPLPSLPARGASQAKSEAHLPQWERGDFWPFVTKCVRALCVVGSWGERRRWWSAA